jgi:hypothetical protein
MYVDEDCCVLVGKTKIEIPIRTEEERWVSVEYIFGNTEISMTATEDLHAGLCPNKTAPFKTDKPASSGIKMRLLGNVFSIAD